MDRVLVNAQTGTKTTFQDQWPAWHVLSKECNNIPFSVNNTIFLQLYNMYPNDCQRVPFSTLAKRARDHKFEESEDAFMVVFSQQKLVFTLMGVLKIASGPLGLCVEGPGELGEVDDERAANDTALQLHWDARLCIHKQVVWVDESSARGTLRASRLKRWFRDRIQSIDLVNFGPGTPEIIFPASQESVDSDQVDPVFLFYESRGLSVLLDDELGCPTRWLYPWLASLPQSEGRVALRKWIRWQFMTREIMTAAASVSRDRCVWWSVEKIPSVVYAAAIKDIQAHLINWNVVGNEACVQLEDFATSRFSWALALESLRVLKKDWIPRMIAWAKIISETWSPEKTKRYTVAWNRICGPIATRQLDAQRVAEDDVVDSVSEWIATQWLSVLDSRPEWHLALQFFGKQHSVLSSRVARRVNIDTSELEALVQLKPRDVEMWKLARCHAPVEARALLRGLYEDGAFKNELRCLIAPLIVFFAIRDVLYDAAVVACAHDVITRAVLIRAAEIYLAWRRHIEQEAPSGTLTAERIEKIEGIMNTAIERWTPERPYQIYMLSTGWRELLKCSPIGVLLIWHQDSRVLD